MNPTPDPRQTARRGLRLAAVLLVATIAAGAAARLSAHAPPPPIDAAALPRTFQAPGAGPVRFSGALEGTAVLPERDGLVRMELVIGADAARPGAAPRVPTDLVVVLDRSGSMMGDKIVHARAAVRALVEGLGEADRFALVAYSDGAAPVIPLSAAGDRRGHWFARIDAIHPDGGTNLSSGLDVALAMVESARSAGRAPRVVLISDGLANQGDASPEGLVARATRAARGEYALSTVGVGADFDEGLMAALADAGTGNFHFLADAGGLDAILRAEFATARETVASGLRVAVAPASGVAVVDAAGYPLAHEAGAVVFQPGSLFAGQERRIWVTLRVPRGTTGTVALGAFSLEYGAGGERHRLALEGTPCVAAVADERHYVTSLDPQSWERSVVVDQYNALRREVAKAVKDGRAPEALAKVRSYRAGIAARNQAIQSPAVASQLVEAEKLEERLRDAASGVAPMAPAETKQLRADGYVEGRPGSRK